MSVHATAVPARRGSFGRLFRYFLQAPERRHQRYVLARAEWIEEARHAPTVQDLIDMSER